MITYFYMNCNCISRELLMDKFVRRISFQYFLFSMNLHRNHALTFVRLAEYLVNGYPGLFQFGQIWYTIDSVGKPQSYLTNKISANIFLSCMIRSSRCAKLILRFSWLPSVTPQLLFLHYDFPLVSHRHTTHSWISANAIHCTGLNDKMAEYRRGKISQTKK